MMIFFALNALLFLGLLASAVAMARLMQALPSEQQRGTDDHLALPERD